MSFAYWMVLAAALLPYLTVFLAKQAGGIDNRAPRRSLEALTGWRKRADWAQRNHFEAFPLFAVAVIVAELHQTSQGRLDLLAGIYVAFRVVYTAMYLADWASLRTLVWLLSFATAIWIFVLGA